MELTKGPAASVTAVVAALAGLSAMPARAQETPPTDARAGGAGSTAQTPPAGAAAGAPSIDATDIIVTAERRAVNIQKAPISITAISGAELAQRGITMPNSLEKVVPGVRIAEIGTNPSLLIRGIGQPVATVYNDPAASYNIEGVPVVRPVSLNGLFFDLERVEILKGPQGTLYGRNATVGAINVLSTRPSHELGGMAEGHYESHDGVLVDGALNIPLGDTLAVRVGGILNHHDGYLSNGTNDAHAWGARGKLLWDPSSDFSVLVTASYFKDDGNGIGDVPLKSPTGSYLDPDHPWRVAVGPPLNPADRATRVPNDAHQNLRSTFVNAEANYNFGAATLTVIPAHIKTDYDALSYAGGFRQLVNTLDRQNSIEARLSSNWSGPLKLIVGGIYIEDLQRGETVNRVAPVLDQDSVFNSVKLHSYAVFAQGTYSITDQLRATAGIRYTHDHKTLDGTVANRLVGPGIVVGAYTSTGDTNFKNTSFKIGLDYDVAPDSMVYASVATGYKAGGFQPGTPPNVYSPEKNTAYTIGIKNRFFDRKVTLNVEGFYWDYRDFQFVQFGFINPLPNFALTTINAPKVRDYGIEAQGAFQLSEHDRISADIAWTQSKYVKFVGPAFPVTGTPESNYAGDHTVRAPVWSGVLAYLHRFDIGGTGGHLDFGLKEQFESKSRIVPQHIPGAVVHGFHMTDADLTYFLPGDRFQIGVYGTNLENKAVVNFAGNTPAGLWGHPRAPRIIGVRAAMRY